MHTVKTKMATRRTPPFFRQNGVDDIAVRWQRVNDRVKRALVQPIRILDCLKFTNIIERDGSSGKHGVFLIMQGLTCNYTVRFSTFATTCTCKDFERQCAQQSGLPCKHILYVYYRVLKLKLHRNSNGLPELDIRTALERLDGLCKVELPTENHDGIDNVRKDDECCVCYDNIDPEHDPASLVSCPHCKHLMHHTCIKSWFEYHVRGGAKRTCPLCRQEWPKEQTATTDEKWTITQPR